jgi:two-component system sensor histidine kinase UhpB
MSFDGPRTATISTSLQESYHSILAIAEVALDGRFLRVNQQFCQLLGYTREELTAKWVRDVTHPDDRAQSVALVERSLHHYEQPIEAIKRYLHRDGTVIWTLLHTTLRRNERGEPTSFLSFMEDVRKGLQEDRLSRALVQRMQEFRDQERQVIARELHDEFGQVLGALKIELGWLSENRTREDHEGEYHTDRLTNLVDGVMASVRRLSHELHPTILDELGLRSALKWLLQETCSLRGQTWNLSTPEPTLRLDAGTKLAIFRICQEGLKALGRNPGTTRVDLELNRERGEVIVRLCDDGSSKPELVRGADGFGLLGVRDRVGLLGGKVELTPRETGGLCLAVSLPNHDEIPPGRVPRVIWDQ